MLLNFLHKLPCLVVLLVVASGCAFSQEKSKYAISESRNIDYLEGQSTDTIQKLNLVTPKGITEYPLLIWIGGGAWSYVDRNVEMDLAKKFAEEGIAVASIGHRLSAATWRDPSMDKGVKHPAHVKDIAASINWLYENAVRFGYNKERIFIGGFSSGAHLAALIGLDHSYLEEVGLNKSVIKGMIPISGAYDISNYYEVFKNGNSPELAESHVMAVFGDTQEDLRDASPTSYLENLEIPILLISDNAIDRYTRLLERRLKEIDFKAYEVMYAPDLNHAALWRDISFENSSRYRKAMVDFIMGNSAIPLN